MPLALPIGSKLAIYADLAEIPPRLMVARSTHAICSTAPLARPRWLHTFLDEIYPCLSWQFYLP